VVGSCIPVTIVNVNVCVAVGAAWHFGAVNCELPILVCRHCEWHVNYRDGAVKEP